MNKTFQIILQGFTLLILLAFIIVFAFTHFYEDRLEGGMRLLFIGILCLYAAFRVFRLYHLWKSTSNPNES